jgi:dipeptidyl aminopeptidase/acylaminoacyl peptidase
MNVISWSERLKATAVLNRCSMCLLWLCFGLTCSAAPTQKGDDVAIAHLRPFTVDDLFKYQDVGSFEGGPYAYSVDGRALAVTRLRAIDTDPSQLWKELRSSELQSNARGDVWVQADMGQPLRNITHGEADRSGWFSPQWSPDGNHLAMLSTRGGGLRLWTWSRTTGRIAQVSRDQVVFGTQQRSIIHDQPYVWLDAHRIIFTALPGGQRRGVASVYEYMQSETPALASAAWRRYLSGTKSTASALDGSGAGISSGANLLITDLSGHETVLARNVDTLLWQPSPKGDAVAFTRETRITPTLGTHLQEVLADSGDFHVEVVKADGARIDVTGDKSLDVLPASLRWAPTGTTLAYLGYRDKFQLAPWVYFLNVLTHRTMAVAVKDMNASPGGRDIYGPLGLTWTAAGKLLVRGARVRTVGKRSRTDARQDWWLISRAGAISCVTCGMRHAPPSVWPEDGRQQFFGLADGKLWQFDFGRGTVGDLTARYEFPVEELISPAPSLGNLYFVNETRSLAPGTYVNAVFLSMEHGVAKRYLIDLRTHAIKALIPPAKCAKLVAVGAGDNSFLYMQRDHSGLSLWREGVRSEPLDLLFRANGFLRGIAEARLVHFAYSSLDGRELNAWLLLPLRYHSGMRYPTITFVYPTYSYSAPAVPSEIESYTSLSSDSVFNMQIAAAHGYAVLFPSVPVAYRDREEVRIKVVNEVMPAVAAAVRRGYADPDRLAVWGTSYGGEAVFGLIARTDRFKAAISSSGLSDLISAYGALDAQYRYDDHAQEHVFEESLSEHGQLNLGGPPWDHWLRYMDNSPIFSIGKVHTPILMTDGDLDFVPMQQSEEFYRALVRQGKPARFVRYWGEGHLLTNPANIRDYWRETFMWLHRFLSPGGDDKPVALLKRAKSAP